MAFTYYYYFFKKQSLWRVLKNIKTKQNRSATSAQIFLSKWRENKVKQSLALTDFCTYLDTITILATNEIIVGKGDLEDLD